MPDSHRDETPDDSCDCCGESVSYTIEGCTWSVGNIYVLPTPNATVALESETPEQHVLSVFDAEFWYDDSGYHVVCSGEPVAEARVDKPNPPRTRHAGTS
jgi:hypothetical protein